MQPFVSALGTELGLTSKEIADIIWLALQMQESDGPEKPSTTAQKPDERSRPSPTHSPSPPDPDEKPDRDSPTKSAEVHHQSNANQAGFGKPLALKVPDARSLREPLSLARSLKPLLRRVVTGWSTVLDEAATVERIADEQLWFPVLKPALEPWLDLALVVDESVSMQIWQRTIAELQRLLSHYGVFRDVRVWGLVTDERGQVQLRPGIGAAAWRQAARRPSELIDPSGRRLILVATDCVSSGWQDGSFLPVLKLWARSGPLAIVQMLPEWLWLRTGLGFASAVRLQSLLPGVPNQQLVATDLSPWDEVDLEAGIKVPVVTLEPEPFAAWTEMVTGKGGAWSPGFVFEEAITPNEQVAQLPDVAAESGAEQRVQRFRVTASPMARRLAGLLAAAPAISLPVVRIIQDQLLPDSQQVHVAEVFLGGLLKPLGEVEIGTNSDAVQYDFLDGVREALLESVPTSDSVSVVEEVSKFVAERLGLSLDKFAAVLRNPQETEDQELINQSRPFAIMTAQILRQLGGEYVKFAEELEDTYRSDSYARAKYAGRSSSGSFARAKYAKDYEDDPKKAEKLFREAIRKGDRTESAVKDLAALLREDGRTDEAIELLLTHREQVDNKQSLNNLLSDMYQSAGRYREAIACLEEILKNTPHGRRPVVLKRIALCQVRQKQYDAAEATLVKVLAQSPKDEVAQRWLEGLRETKRTGVYDELDALFLAQDTLPDAGTTLSGFLNFYLERCEYAGLEASKVASKAFTERDVNELLRWAEQLGIKRPRERANYYLSAAKILIELGQGEELRPSVYLRNFCAAMGDACIAEQKPKDVVHSYYAEGFLVAPDWVSQLEVKLSQFVMLYCYPMEELLKSANYPTLEVCLGEALNITGLASQVIEGLWHLSWFSCEVSRFLINSVHPNKALRERVQSLCYELLGESGQPTDDQAAFLELWERGRVRMRRLNQEISDEINYLYSAASSLDTLQDQIVRVQRLESKMWAALDRQRLKEIREVLNSMYDYSQQQEYGEREYHTRIIENRVRQIAGEIEESPTKYSLELFRPYLFSLGKALEEHFGDIQRASEPDSLAIELAIESYPNDETLECQVTIYNKRGKSPASAIKIQVQDSPDEDYFPQQRDIVVTEALAGGQSVTSLIPVKVTAKARQSEVFTLYYQLSYTTLMGQRTHSGTLPIRLYPATDFIEIFNPYARYAEGSVVEDEHMFYGRDQLLANLLSAIQNTTSPRNFVIYGQKRTGKSSVLYQLKRRLRFPIIPVSFSIGDMVDYFSMATFLYRIIQKVEEEFEELADEGYPHISVSRPGLDELERNPQLRFQDYMTSLRRCLKREAIYRDVRIMLLINNFSYIYTEIKRGRIADTFMKFWKALLEQRYFFGSVLVGHEVMGKFIEQFPNEFQMTEYKLSYLDPNSANELIVDPIRIPDTSESRYRGNAVNRLIELTAGNPYYIQIFCSRLVQYMNRKKAIYVTDADIDQVKKKLLSGNNSLRLPQFDNLISASDSDVDEIAKEDSEAVLRAIAIGSPTKDYCDRKTINVVATSASIDAILDDLCRREVLEKRENALFRIRVKLFKEWLLAN